MLNSRMDSRCFCGAEIDIAGTGQPHLCRAHGHSARLCWTPLRAQRMPHVRSKKFSGWRGLPARLFVAYWNVSVAVLGRHGGTV